MKKIALKVFIFSFLLASYSTNAQSKIITINDFGDKEMLQLEKNAPKDGWVLVKYNKDQVLINFSNKDYVLFWAANCTNPKYLIKYSNHYRDGDFGGLDYASSAHNSHSKTVFLIDGKEFKDPFTTKNNLPIFQEALKKGKKMTISFFDNEFDPNEGEDILKLNRSIDFKLNNSELLDEKSGCKTD